MFKVKVECSLFRGIRAPEPRHLHPEFLHLVSRVGFKFKFPETVKSDGARHMGSTVWLDLWVKGERESERERGESPATLTRNSFTLFTEVRN